MLVSARQTRHRPPCYDGRAGFPNFLFQADQRLTIVHGTFGAAELKPSVWTKVLLWQTRRVFRQGTSYLRAGRAGP